MINQVITYLKGFSQEQWLWIALAGVILGYIVYNRKQYVNLFDAAVIASEESFKHGDNKKKLNAALKFVEYRTDKLPYPVRILLRKFFSRKKIEKAIEKALQKFSDVFGTGRKIDIEEAENDEE
nr:MAG TPA: holin [Caudoviricetes sp.]